MAKSDDPKIESEIVRSDSFKKNRMGLTGLVHQRKQKGVSNLEIMIYTHEGGQDALEQEVPDGVFSDAIEVELSSAIWACLFNLGKTGYFNETPKCTISFENGRERVEVRDWLNPEALNHKGEAIFEIFGSEGEEFVAHDDEGAEVSTISVAAQLVAHD